VNIYRIARHEDEYTLNIQDDDDGVESKTGREGEREKQSR